MVSGFQCRGNSLQFSQPPPSQVVPTGRALPGAAALRVPGLSAGCFQWRAGPRCPAVASQPCPLPPVCPGAAAASGFPHQERNESLGQLLYLRQESKHLLLVRCLKWAIIRVTLCLRSAMAGLAPASGVGLLGGRAAPIRMRAGCPTTHSLRRGPQSRRSGSLHPVLSNACLVPDSVAFVLLDSCENSQGGRARCCEDSFFPD